MSRPIIKMLSVELSNMIAAGEVVERLVSVVKELVENSIDAKADFIKIDLKDSGFEEIKVSDNGIGMTKADIELAVLPHATSKIDSVDDLFTIKTLGFRGEAIPSICSVSNLEIKSSIDGFNGYNICYKGGKKVFEKEISFSKGTQIVVSELFFNTPARLKHLNSNSNELSQIVAFINRMALAYSNVKFILSNNDRILFETRGDDDCLMVLKSIYGLEVAKNMIEFDGSNGLYKITGFTSSNSVFRSNKNSITIIINHRVIKNANLVYAITDAYKSVLPIGKYPICVLMIEAEESLVDVNVHPTKQEVRFTDEFRLKDLITKSISKALMNVELVYSTFVSFEKVEEPIEEKDEFFESLDDFDIKTPVKPSELIEETNYIEEEFKYVFDDNYKPKFELDLDQNEDKIVQTQIEIKNESFFSNLEYIGQFNKTYLLLEYNDELYLLDQHAGMERCMYEKIRNAFFNDNKTIIQMLIPITMDVPLYEINQIIYKENLIKNIGIEFEKKNNSLIIKTIPSWIPKGKELEYIQDIFEYALKNNSFLKNELLDDFIKMLSCKQSIKANSLISLNEVKSLLGSLDDCENPFTCPHGRPVIVKLSKYEIEKMFKRVM